jgi:hypothetical protein
MNVDLANWFKPPPPDPVILAQQELEKKIREEAESKTVRGRVRKLIERQSTMELQL